MVEKIVDAVAFDAAVFMAALWLWLIAMHVRKILVERVKQERIRTATMFYKMRVARMRAGGRIASDSEAASWGVWGAGS